MPTYQKNYNAQYFDEAHNPIIFGKEIGSGGEGRVCLVKGNSKVVAKLYLDKALQKGDKTGKIKAMCALYDNELAKFSALPQKAIYDSNGKVVGFIMEHLNLNDFKEIHLLYGTIDRKKHFDYADWGFMVHSAQNLACAVETLHNKGIVIGDINEKNILVDKNAMIKLIDCDSYQVEYNNQFYLCEVGKSEYTAPELQGKSFKGIHRTKNHDCFGLAVMIFQILMLAKHPYTGINAPHDRGEAIEKGYYCFSSNSAQPTPNSAQWYYSQLYSTIDFEVKELFERAFTTNSSRPTAKEWINALGNLERGLHACTISKKHRYYGGSCIWCKLEQKGFRPFDISANSYSQYNSTTYPQTPYNPNRSNTPRNKPKPKPQNNYIPPTPQQTQSYGTPTAPISNNVNWKLIIGIIIVLFIIGALNSNNEINNTNSNTPTSNVAQEQIHYSDAQREQDLRNYKDSFIQILQHNYKSLLNQNNEIDKNILAEIIFNKDGSVELGNIVSSGRINPIPKKAILQSLSHHVDDLLSFEPLPESYNSDKLKLELVFTKTGVYYKGEEPQESISDKEIAVQENNEQQIKNELKTQNIERPQNYTDSGTYLTNVKNILSKNFNTTYSVDCTVKFTPPDDVKILKDEWNGDVAYNILLNSNIPKFYDSNGNIKPLIIKFSGHSIVSVTFETPVQNTPKNSITPKTKSSVPQQAKNMSAVSKSTNQQKATETKKITVQESKIEPNKPKTDIEKSTDYFFE